MSFWLCPVLFKNRLVHLFSGVHIYLRLSSFKFNRHSHSESVNTHLSVVVVTAKSKLNKTIGRILSPVFIYKQISIYSTPNNYYFSPAN